MLKFRCNKSLVDVIVRFVGSYILMKISKNELKKISRKLRKISSDVINAYYLEQNGFLDELIAYINNTELLKNYIDSIEYDVGNLKSNMTKINRSYGRMTLDLGSDSKKRAFLLYKAFIIIKENNYPTYNFGWYYAGGNKYQDMAKAFGDRLVYPFVSELGEYMKDIATDMGYDESNVLYNINVNSSGVQVNIAEKNSSISASQVNNWATQEVVDKISKIEEEVSKIENQDIKENLTENLEIIKAESIKPDGKKLELKPILKNMHILATTAAMLPDLAQAIKMLANTIGINI